MRTLKKIFLSLFIFLLVILLAAPFLAALLDYVENSLHLLMLAVLRATPAALVFLASLAAAVKWALAAISVGAIVMMLLTRLNKFVTRKPRHY